MSNRKEAEPSLDSNWHTSGVVIHGNAAHLVSLQRSLLIMDTQLWAVRYAQAYERDAKTATTEDAKVMFQHMAYDLRRWVAGDPAITEERMGIWRCSIPVAMRAEIGLLQVNRENFAEYIKLILAHAMPVRREFPATFLLINDPAEPEIYVTKDSAYVADYAASGVPRQVVTNNHMRLMYNLVDKVYPPEAGADTRRLRLSKRQTAGHCPSA